MVGQTPVSRLRAAASGAAILKQAAPEFIVTTGYMRYVTARDIWKDE
jgi:folate-dependent phosphoribosylglycinamide formyltransferase PurN